EGKNLSNSDAINCLRIRQNYANRSRFCRGIYNLAFGRVFQKIHMSAAAERADSTINCPRIDNRRSWMPQSTDVGLESSVPHVPCSEPKYHALRREPGQASALKNGYRNPPSTRGLLQGVLRLPRHCASGQETRPCRCL